MKWTWDPAAGAIYLQLAEREPDGEKLPVADTVCLGDDDMTAEVLLDIDRETGQVAGIEILIADGGSTFVKLQSLLREKPEILGACPSAHCPHLEKVQGCSGGMHG